MKGIAVASIISIFSVVIPTLSGKRTFVYNYENFGDIFHQGQRDDFNIYKYEDIDTIFDTEYNGTNIGGAFLVDGTSTTATSNFKEYVIDIIATFYCGGTYAEEGTDSLWLMVGYSGGHDAIYVCEERGWHYNYTWIPPTRFDHSMVSIHSMPSDISIHLMPTDVSH